MNNILPGPTYLQKSITITIIIVTQQTGGKIKVSKVASQFARLTERAHSLESRHQSPR